MPEDSIEEHIEDTLIAGHYHNNPEAVRAIISQAPKAIETLQHHGVKFAQTSEKKFDLHLEAGHRHPRILHTQDTTGRTIEEALAYNARKHPNISIWEETFVYDLIVQDGICYGIAISPSHHSQNQPYAIAQKIVIATGGLGYIYSKTTNPNIATGDGIAMAYRAGAKLADLEFIQFHPTALDTDDDQVFLITEALRGEGAHIINEKGERFMQKHHPAAELAPRDIVSRSIFYEQQVSPQLSDQLSGQLSHPLSHQGSIYLDLQPIDSTLLLKKYPTIIKKLEEREWSPSYPMPIPITPAAHYSCGGIATDLEGGTSIKNLYAIGEVACTGLHGANRLASNSLLEGVVMGQIVGNSKNPAAISATSVNALVHTHTSIQSRINQTFLEKSKYIREEIKKIMWMYGGIIRNKEGLETGIQALKKLELSFPPEPQQPYGEETRNMLQTGMLVLEAALKREKSLGCHWRSDRENEEDG